MKARRQELREVSNLRLHNLTRGVSDSRAEIARLENEIDNIETGVGHLELEIIRAEGTENGLRLREEAIKRQRQEIQVFIVELERVIRKKNAEKAGLEAELNRQRKAAQA
jgi:chromosome segregation ATPase